MKSGNATVIKKTTISSPGSATLYCAVHWHKHNGSTGSEQRLLRYGGLLKQKKILVVKVNAWWRMTSSAALQGKKSEYCKENIGSFMTVQNWSKIWVDWGVPRSLNKFTDGRLRLKEGINHWTRPEFPPWSWTKWGHTERIRGNKMADTKAVDLRPLLKFKHQPFPYSKFLFTKSLFTQRGSLRKKHLQERVSKWNCGGW